MQISNNDLELAYRSFTRVVPLGDQYALELAIGGESEYDWQRVAVIPNREWARNLRILTILAIADEVMLPHVKEWVEAKRKEPL